MRETSTRLGERFRVAVRRRMAVGLCLATAAFPTALHAQERVVAGALTHEDGLTDNRVSEVLQDSRGFMWFATRSGLNRYDGYEIKQYFHDPDDPDSLADNVVGTLLEDTSGDIWIGLNRGGVDRFDRETERFFHYPHVPEDPGTVGGSLVRRLFLDSSGMVWVGTDAGVSVIDPGTDRVTRLEHETSGSAGAASPGVFGFAEDSSGATWIATARGLRRFGPSAGETSLFLHDPSDPNSLSDDRVLSVLVDSRGVVWAGTAAGLNSFEPDTRGFTHYVHDPADPGSLSGDHVVALYEDSTRALWVGTTTGINRLDPATGRLDRFGFEGGAAIFVGEDRVVDIHEDSGGTVWVAALSGLSQFDREARRFRDSFHDLKDSYSLTDDRIRDLYEDADGVLWVGTVRGVNRLVVGGFTHFATSPDTPASSRGPQVNALLEDRAGNVWVGTAGGLVEKRDPRTNETSRYELDVEEPEGPAHRSPAATIHEDDRGIIWVGVDTGLVRLDPVTGARRSFPLEEGGAVFAIHQDGESLLVGTSQGIWTFDREAGVFAPYPRGARAPELQRAVVAIVPDGGILWLVTDGGVVALDTDSGEVEAYPHRAVGPGGMFAVRVNAVWKDAGGTLWVATDEALERLDPGTARFTHFREPGGLTNLSVYDILEDAQGHLWLPTRNGMLKFDPVTEEFTRYGRHEGMRSSTFTRATHVGRSGNFYVGTMGGFVRFDPNNIDPGRPPRVVITDLEIGRRSAPIGEGLTLQQSITETGEITLSHADRVVTFEFAALSYTAPDLHRYRFQMEGLDPDWIEVDASDHHATYMNLPAGDYTLRVVGSDHRGNWNEQGVSIRVIVTPPWWETNWFRGLALIGIAAVVVLGHRIRTRGLTRHNVELQAEIDQRKRAEAERAKAEQERARAESERAEAEEEVRRRQQELAHTARQTTAGQLAASLAHEINQPLTAIVANAQAARRLLTAPTPDTDEVEAALADIADEGRRASAVIHELREFLTKGESTSEPLDINALVSEASRILLAEARMRGFSISLSPEEDLPPVLGNRVQLEQVLINLVVNGLDAMREAEASGGDSHELMISTRATEEGAVEVSVRDSGTGIAAEGPEKVFESFFTTKAHGMGMGLAICTSIVEAHGGRLWATNNADGGATFRFTIPVAD